MAGALAAPALDAVETVWLETDFTQPLDEDWILEGHGRAETEDGHLLLV